MRFLIAISLLLVSLLPMTAQQRGCGAAVCPLVKIRAERLHDLNQPRHGHMSLCVNGEPTVIGGRTTNFVPIATAEYFKNGEWHEVPLAYSHDDGCSVELSTGKVLIVGGHEKALGIGQTFSAELYDPVTHTSEGFASLDTKRSMPAALALDSGRAVIAGNWYHADNIEMYDGKKSFFHVKECAEGRSTPFILRTSRDNALIVSAMDTLGAGILHPVADRLRGDPLHIPLLDQWRLRIGNLTIPSQVSFIGNEATGDYSYLLMLENERGQLAIARVKGEEFSLLPTDMPVPKTSKWGVIRYYYPILADRQNQRAYIIGLDSVAFYTANPTKRVYVLIIDYANVPARLTLGYTDLLTDCDAINPILTEDGNLMLTGGIPTGNNFQPTASTWLLHVSPKAQMAGIGFPLWGWAIAILAAVALSALIFWVVRRKGSQQQDTVTPPLVEETVQNHEDEGEQEADLMERISQVMEKRQLYLNPDLKVADIADALNTNQRAISDCINTQRGTFRQFVNTYRVAYAQQLLRNQPDVTITEVWMSAGFSSESTFFRIFKAATGCTPNDWRQTLQ